MDDGLTSKFGLRSSQFTDSRALSRRDTAVLSLDAGRYRSCYFQRSALELFLAKVRAVLAQVRGRRVGDMRKVVIDALVLVVCVLFAAPATAQVRGRVPHP